MTQHTVEIERPIENVFAALTDVRLTGRWYPGEVEEWWVTPPPVGIGSVRRARVSLLGRASENEAVVTAYEPPHRAAMRGRSPSAPFEIELSFAPTRDGTHVEVNSTFHLRGVLRLIGPLFIGRYERDWDRGLANLKRMMEAGEI